MISVFRSRGLSEAAHQGEPANQPRAKVVFNLVLPGCRSVVSRRVSPSKWAIAQLEAASLDGPLLIKHAVYAELAVRYDRIEDIETLREDADLETAPMPRSRREVFTQYRRFGGAHRRDAIGAYAAVVQLLPADA